MRVWKTENLYVYAETPLYPQKVGVWTVISQQWIIRHMFFESNHGYYSHVINWLIQCNSVQGNLTARAPYNAAQQKILG